MSEAPQEEDTTPHGKKSDPFVTLRIVIIVVVPLILIAVLTGLDTKFFSLFESDAEQEPKSKSASQVQPKPASKSVSAKTNKKSIIRPNTPPP